MPRPEDDFDKFQAPVSVPPAPALPASNNSSEAIGGGGGGVPLGGGAGRIDFNKPGDPLSAVSPGGIDFTKPGDPLAATHPGGIDFTTSNEPRLPIGPDPVDRAPPSAEGGDLGSTARAGGVGRVLRQRRADYDERVQTVPATIPSGVIPTAIISRGRTRSAEAPATIVSMPRQATGQVSHSPEAPAERVAPSQEAPPPSEAASAAMAGPAPQGSSLFAKVFGAGYRGVGLDGLPVGRPAPAPKAPISHRKGASLFNTVFGAAYHRQLGS